MILGTMLDAMNGGETGRSYDEVEIKKISAVLLIERKFININIRKLN